MRRAGAVIAGAGPAGCAAAIRLAKSGAQTLLIERSMVTKETVCGGFLSYDGAAKLADLGISMEEIGARPISKLRLSDKNIVHELNLPFDAYGISRAIMDRALQSKAAAHGAEILRGVSVKSVDNGTVYLSNDSKPFNADAFFLATGKHNLRGFERPSGEWKHASVGLRWTIAASAELSRKLGSMIELIAFRKGYAGLLLRDDGTANLCLSVAHSRMKKAGGPEALLAELASEQPAFARYLDMEQQGERATIAAVPYGWRAKSGVLGEFRIGDQAAVIASVVGDGMSIALGSGIKAADAYLSRGAAAGETFQAEMATESRGPLAVAELVRRGAENRWSRSLLLAAARYLPATVQMAARATRTR